MPTLRRFVWWKCVFWTGIGIVGGLAAASLWSPVGAPGGATRVAVERFVVTLTGPATAQDAVTDVVLFPLRDGVRLITFDLRSAGKTVSGYTYATTPFLTAQNLKTTVAAGRRFSLETLGSPNFVYATTLRTAADTAIAAVLAQPHHQWATLLDWFDHLKAANPAFHYQIAWWAEPVFRRDLLIAVGAVLVGGVGATLTRRSPAELLAADLLRNARPTLAPAPVAFSAVDLSEVERLDALLEAQLAGGAKADDTPTEIVSPAATASAPIAALGGGPLAALAEMTQEEKAYAGEFYPTVRGPKAGGFSLIELLVSIGVIGVLIAILLPTLIGARRSAGTITCAANLRSIGQGMGIYLQQNQNTFPPAYLYIGSQIVNGVQTPTSPSAGYVHWSSYLYGSGAIAASAFTCPSMNRGGLPPTNTPPANRDPGQSCPSDTVIDQQVPRLAYTVNEILCPRNKFVTPPFGGQRIYRYVKVTEVRNSSRTILGTEMIDNGAAISYDTQGSGWILSHRPLSGFVGVNGELNMYLIPVNAGYRAVTTGDLDPDPNTAGSDTHSRLDLVGRNHGKPVGYPDHRLSNFLYVDGHVETKSIYDTMQPFEWGEKFYSLVPNNDLVVGP